MKSLKQRLEKEKCAVCDEKLGCLNTACPRFEKDYWKYLCDDAIEGKLQKEIDWIDKEIKDCSMLFPSNHNVGALIALRKIRKRLSE